MRLPLATLEIFTAIARHGSLRAAADALNLKPSTVSHQLKVLENQLGVALFIRTTRSVKLTDAGRALILGTGPAFEQLHEAVERARTTGLTASGHLKLAMPEFAYHLLIGPMLKAFHQAYPDIEVELSLTDAFSDILEEGLHAGFRLGDRIAHDMVAVRLTKPLRLGVFASPGYLEQHGRPHSPRALLQHHCIRYRFPTSGRIASWAFESADGGFTVDVTGSLIANSLPAALDLAKQGLGLFYSFREYCKAALSNGELVALLDGHLPDTPGLFIYFPREYRTMMPLRLFLDHLQASLRA